MLKTFLMASAIALALAPVAAQAEITVSRAVLDAVCHSDNLPTGDAAIAHGCDLPEPPKPDPKAYGLTVDPVCHAGGPNSIFWSYAHCDWAEEPERISSGPIPGASQGSPAYAIRDHVRATVILPPKAVHVRDIFWQDQKTHFCVDYDIIIESRTLPTAMWPAQHHQKCGAY